ncbi:MAG: GNAT family N-acetyltransferase [Christensenellales bacterium]
MKTTDNFTFQKLIRESDYQETATLIYQTDPFIYKDLFGNVENARQILRYSFENPKSVFFKEFIWIVKNEKDEVIGCALNHANDFRWNQDDMLFDYERAGIEPPASFFCVSNYMDKTYNYRKLGRSICNVSVREDYHKQGVGSFLLKNLFEHVGKELFELTVFVDNIAAIRLYEKFGFKIVGNAFDDYGGDSLLPVKCYKMVFNG